MFKIMMMVLALATMFASQSVSMPELLKEEVMFSAYNNGNQIIMTEDEVSSFDKLFTEILENCRPMPAYGVSLHDETIKAVNKGVWIRYEFDKTLEVNGLPFDELLINLTKDMYGFNIIRGNEGRFDGRCFYIDVPRNMDKLYEYMLSLPVSETKFELKQVETKESSLLTDDLKIKEVSLDCDSSEKCEDCGTQATSAESLPSINKDNKDKSNTVIEQDDLVSTNALIEALEF